MIKKAKGNIGTLPLYLREQINQKLRNNTETYETIATWLLGCPIEIDGPPVSTLYEGTKDPVHCCEVALQRWFNSSHYEVWQREAALNDDVLRRVRNVETTFTSLTDDRKDNYAMSVVLAGFEKIMRGEADAKDIFMLVTAYCNMRGLKKGDAQADQITAKLSKIADDAKAARDTGKPLDADQRTAILDKVDDVLLNKGGHK